MSYAEDELRADFAAFADPATMVELVGREIRWTQQGKRCVARLLTGSQPFPRLLFGGLEYGYRDFFASTHMADLRSVAETQVRLNEDKNYVDSTLEVRNELHPGIDILSDLTTPKVRARTSIIFVQGDAGIGKTTMLKQLATTLASKFIEGGSDYLALYVDAQNRSLARLDEAVALVLQDMRARFTYHALATLARLGLLVPIIDGFDELLGARGYDDALSSLLRFLERLRGEGVVITSARSTFYKFQNVGWLQKVKSSERLDFEIVTATLQPWDDAQIEKAVVKLGVAEEIGVDTAHDVLVQIKSSAGQMVWQLFSIPFFVFSFFGLIKALAQKLNEKPERSALRDELPALTQMLATEGLSFLVVGLIRREVPKLRGRDDQPLLVPSDHEKFLREVAEEMWMQETRVLDRSSVESLLEMVVEGEGKETLLEVLKGRASVHPLLVSVGEGALAFRHELFFSYFLAHVLFEAIPENHTKFQKMLGRSTITPQIAEELAKLVAVKFSQGESLAVFLKYLAPEHALPSIRATVSRNAGQAVAALMRKYSTLFDSLTIPAMNFDRTDMRATALNSVKFDGCEFEGVDIRDAAWNSVDLSNCRVARLLLSEKTVLSQSKFPPVKEIYGIVYDEEKIFEPGRIAEILRKNGSYQDEVSVAELTPLQRKKTNLFRKLVRITNHTFRFSNDDLENAGILQDSNWQRLESSLQRHRLLEVDTISRRGASGNLRRFAVSPDEIEAAMSESFHNSNLREFWKDYLMSE